MNAGLAFLARVQCFWTCKPSEIYRTREQYRARRAQAARKAAAIPAVPRTKPVRLIGDVLHGGAQGHRLGLDLEGIASPHIVGGVRVQRHPMIVGRVLFARVVDVAGQGQPRDVEEVILRA